MALSGDLQTMPVTDLLQWIETTRKTGIIEFKRGVEWKKIFLQKGQILFVSSSQEKEKIGRFLIKNGALREEDLYDCLEENERTGKKLTQILEDRKLITHEQLYAQVVLLIKEILFDLFQWEKGTFLFHDRKLPEGVKGPLALATGQILFGVMARIDESHREAGEKTAVPGKEERVSGRQRVRGRIVLKVDDKKFTLPGSYEKSGSSSYRKVGPDKKKKGEK